MPPPPSPLLVGKSAQSSSSATAAPSPRREEPLLPPGPSDSGTVARVVAPVVSKEPARAQAATVVVTGLGREEHDVRPPTTSAQATQTSVVTTSGHAEVPANANHAVPVSVLSTPDVKRRVDHLKSIFSPGEHNDLSFSFA
jgi:hypothetical protein